MKEKKKIGGQSSAELIKKSLKESWAVHKTAWIVSIVIICVVAVAGTVIGVVNSASFKFNMTYVLASKEFEAAKDDGSKVMFYLEKNSDFKISEATQENQNETNNEAFLIYYFDENGEKVYLEEGTYVYTNQAGEEKTLMPTLGFLAPAYVKYQKIQKVFNVVKWVALALAVVGSILAWYLWDLKQYNKKQKAKYDRKNKMRKKK